MTKTVSAPKLRAMLLDGQELALLDVREEGTFSQSHLLFARPMPLSRLELRMADLVPRRSTRIVLCDAGDGLAERAADRLAGFGYGDVAVLDGGTKGWEDAGFVLFSGYNVPSKAFGEYVEHQSGTPSVSAEELKDLMDSGADMVVLDSRPWDEYHRMNIPTGIDMPGAELAYRVHDVAPSPETLVVVNCAGRTRSIIGAQSLINAGIPNRVVALRNGTMGWELAGFTCERGQERRAPEPSAAGLEAGRAAASRVAERFGVRTIDMAMLDRWRGESDRRSLYLLDVRSPEEYAAGHMPGSISAPGGQLVQGTDLFVGTLGARVVLIDDTGVRATMTASWLIQMGIEDAVVLTGGLDTGALDTGAGRPTVLGLESADPDLIQAGALNGLLENGVATVVDLSTSRNYAQGHVPGAWFAVRARLEKALDTLPESERLVLTCEDGVLSRIAAAEATTLSKAPVAVLDGGNAAWSAAGFELASGEESMADTPDDVWLKPYDRNTDITAAMNEYLAWEIDLVRQIEADGTARFRHVPA